MLQQEESSDSISQIKDPKLDEMTDISYEIEQETKNKKRGKASLRKKNGEMESSQVSPCSRQKSFGESRYMLQLGKDN